MGQTIKSLFAASAVIFAASAALAGEPVAIVERTQAVSADIAAMDTLRTGQVLDLKRDGRLVIGYVNSCIRETIVGGTVRIGKDESRVENGRV